MNERIHRYRVDGRPVLSVVTQRGEERCVTTLKRQSSTLLTEGRFVLKNIGDRKYDSTFYITVVFQKV